MFSPNVFQMTPFAFQARLQATRETAVSVSHEHLPLWGNIALILAVVAVFKSSIVWGLFSYTLSFTCPQG